MTGSICIQSSARVAGVPDTARVLATSRMPVRPRTDVRLNLTQLLMGRGLDTGMPGFL
jgi:hypothetical protein